MFMTHVGVEHRSVIRELHSCPSLFTLSLSPHLSPFTFFIWLVSNFSSVMEEGCGRTASLWSQIVSNASIRGASSTGARSGKQRQAEHAGAQRASHIADRTKKLEPSVAVLLSVGQLGSRLNGLERRSFCS